MNNHKICFVLPAKNEESTIKNVLDEVIDISKEIQPETPKIIVVSDSTDQTNAICEKYENVILEEGQNNGLGEAMYYGLKKASETNSKYICSLDSDGQVDLQEILKFFKEIEKNENDLILGSRFLERNLIKYNYKFLNNFGTKLLRFFINFKTKLNITDSHGGIRIMKSGVAKKLKMMGDHTYVQETIVDAVENGFKVKEIPSIWLERKAGLSKVVRSKIHYIINVFPILFIRCNLHKIIFYPLSAFLFFLSLIFLIFYNTIPDIVFPLLLLTFSFLLIFFGYSIEQYKNLIFYLRGLKK